MTITNAIPPPLRRATQQPEPRYDHRVRFVSGLVMALCCGCFSKPLFKGGEDNDGGVDASCMFGSWSSLTPIPVFEHEVTGEPTITRDRLLMYWSVQTNSSPEHWDIRYADRSTPGGTFVVHPSATVDPAGTSIDADPAITDDGLTIIYRSGTSASPTFYQATRSSRMDTVWTTTALTSLASERPASLDISADGRTVYWAVGGQDLYSATRSSATSDDFVVLGVIAQGIQWPSISGDQRTLYYVGGANEVWQMTRSDPTSAFESPMMIFTGAIDPDVTSDGTAIVVGANDGVSISERSCM